MRFATVTFAVVVLFALSARADEPAPIKQSKSGKIDCNKTPNVEIGNGKLKLAFTGACKNVTMNGGESELIADSIVNLNVNGASNKIVVTRVDNISLVGAKNEVTYTSCVDPNKTDASVNTVGKDNVVKKGVQVVTDAAKKVDQKKIQNDANKITGDAQKQVQDALGGLKLP